MEEYTEISNHKLSAAEKDKALNLIYQMYPRKEGKLAGMKKLHVLVKTQQDADKILLATMNYAALLKAKGTPKDFTLMFSTFVNGRWMDYEAVDLAEDPHLEILKTVALQFRFSRYLPAIKIIWPEPEAFRAFMAARKAFYLQSVGDPAADNDRYRNFLASCLSKQLGA